MTKKKILLKGTYLEHFEISYCELMEKVKKGEISFHRK